MAILLAPETDSKTGKRYGILDRHVCAFMTTFWGFEHRVFAIKVIHVFTFSLSFIAVASALHSFHPGGNNSGNFIPSPAHFLAAMMAFWSLALDPFVGLAYLPILTTQISLAIYFHDHYSSYAPLTYADGLWLTSLIIETVSHFLLQHGPPNTMLRRDMKTFGKALVPLIAIPYFVSTFGIYWIVMDLALNVFGHRKEFNAWIKTTLTENCRVHEEIFKERVKDDEKKKKKKE